MEGAELPGDANSGFVLIFFQNKFMYAEFSRHAEQVLIFLQVSPYRQYTFPVEFVLE